MSKNNNEIKHEDLIMKKAMDVFAVASDRAKPSRYDPKGPENYQ